MENNKDEQQNKITERLRERIQNFNKGIDEQEIKNKRENFQVELRKVKRDEVINKMRKDFLGIEAQAEENEGQEMLQSVPSLEQEVPKRQQSVSLMPELIRLLESDSDTDKLRALLGFRKLLSLDSDPPIQEIINANLLPKFIALLQRQDNAQLQMESVWALTNIASGTHDHCKIVIDHGIVPLLVQLLISPVQDLCHQTMWCLGNIAGDCAKQRDIVIDSGAVPILLEIVANATKFDFVKNGVWVLSNICRGKPPPKYEKVKVCIPTLAYFIMNQTDADTLSDCCWALSQLSDGPNENIQDVITSGCIPHIVNLFRSQKNNIKIPAVRTIGNICTGTDVQTQYAIDLGAIPHVKSLLEDQSRDVRKEAVWTMSNVAAGTTEQIEVLINLDVIPIINVLLNEDIQEVKRECAQVLSNATDSKQPDLVRRLLTLGIMEPLCNMLKKCDVRLLNIALDAIDNILATGLKTPTHDLRNPQAVLFDEIGGLDKLEELQGHPNQGIYERTIILMEKYFGLEEDEDDQNEFNQSAQTQDNHQNSLLANNNVTTFNAGGSNTEQQLHPTNKGYSFVPMNSGQKFDF